MSAEKENMIPGFPQEKEPTSFRLIFALALAGLLSGIVLVGTFIYTDPIIKANKAEATRKAIFKVLPGCTSFTTLGLVDGKLAEQEVRPENKSESGKDELVIYAGYNDNKELLGFAIPGSEAGFQDIIASIFGYDASKGVIIGFEVLDSKETPGLGDKIKKDDDFLANFTSLAVAPEIVAVKKGEKHQPNQLETISGATISSKAIVKLLNNTMAVWKPVIEEYISSNDIQTLSRND